MLLNSVPIIFAVASMVIVVQLKHIVDMDAYQTVGNAEEALNVLMVLVVVNTVIVEKQMPTAVKDVNQIVTNNLNAQLLTHVLMVNVVEKMEHVEMMLLIVVQDANKTVGLVVVVSSVSKINAVVSGDTVE